jgi:hypothetical protein
MNRRKAFRPPTSVVVASLYGATADAGEINDSDSHAAKRWVDATGGLDANAGTSPGAAWQTLTKVNDQTDASSPMAADTAFLFKRGESFGGLIVIEQFSNGNYHYGAYGSGNRPIIVNDGSSAQNTVVFQNKDTAEFKNININGNNQAGDFGFFGGTGNSDGHVVQNVRIYNCAQSGYELKGNNLTLNNVQVDTCDKSGANGAGIDGGDYSNFTLTHSSIFNNGAAAANLNHQVYLHTLAGALIQWNHIYATSDLGNHALVMHGLCSDIQILDNLMDGCANGIGINTGYGSASGPEEFLRYTINRNIIRNCGLYSGAGAGFLITGMVDSTIDNNICYKNKGQGIVFYEGNPASDSYLDDSVNTNCKVRHNVFGASSDAGAGLSGFGNIQNPSAQTDILYENNIFYSPTTGAEVLFDVPTGIPDAEIICRNCCFWAPNHADGKVIRYHGTAMTVSVAMATAPSVFVGLITTDPKFVDAANGDFRIQSGSSCYHAGANSGVTTDFTGASRHSTTPSIGPYEAVV